MRKLVSGSIIEIYVKDINRYIYIKYIDVRDLIKEMSYPFQFRIYRDFYTKPLISIDNLNFSDLLISPLHLTGFKELIKTGEWKVIDSQDLTDYDKLQHHYKMAWPPSLIVHFDDVKQWRVLKNINNVNQGEIVPYYRCAHLEYAENLGASHLSLRVTIEYWKANGQEVNLDKSKWSKFDHVLYSRYVNMPLYTKVPEEFKGKLLPETYSTSPTWLK